MNKYQFTMYSENGSVLYTACEYANTRWEALELLVNYPYKNPLNDKVYNMDIHEVKN